MNTITPRSGPRLVLFVKPHVAAPKPAERRRAPVYFLKAHIAGDGQLGGYAHKGGYALINGHWHKLDKDKPAPKSAPKASHPEAAGSHIPAKHLTDDEWAQLKLPESNVNAPTYNSQLDKLKQMAEAGNVTGIVGSSYGVNTYGKKLAVVANHLLGKYGSPHKVAPGQKAGEHPAVQGSVDAVVEHKDAVIKEAIEHLKEDAKQSGMPAGEAAEDKALVQKLESAHAVKLPQIPMPGPVQLLQPTGLKADAHGAVVQQIKGLYESGDLAELKKVKDALFTPAYTGAILYKGKGAKGIVKYLDATIADLESKAPIVAAAPSPSPSPSPVAAVQPASTSQVGMIPWDKMVLPATNSNAGTHNKKVAQIKKLAEAGDVAGLEAMKFGSNNYAKKQALLAQTAIAALKESPAKPQAVAPSPASASNGPKDGDTKPAADGGMLVFKDGHWHKQVTEAPGKQWDYSDNNEGMSNAKTLVVGTKNNGTLYIAKTNGGYEVGELDAGGDYMLEPKLYSSLANVVKYLQTGGYKDIVPSNSDLAKFGDANWKPAAVSTAPSAPTVLSVSPNGIEPMDSWTQTGPQGGSNPGGKFKDSNGQEWYCKFPADEDHAKSEVLAANLYALAGVAGQDAKLITRNGKIGIASRWMRGTKESAGKLAKAEGVHSGFAVDAWLSNWDVIGATNDNLLLDSNGKAVRIDAGGSLGYRAMGAKKAFTNKVADIKNMLDPSTNPSASAVFGSMTQADITASVAKVAAISDAAIFDVVNQHGGGSLEDKKKLAATLIARKRDLIKQYPDAGKKKKTPVFDPSKITAPPDFMNWGGSGSPGPSSKLFVNQANHEAVQAIYAEAKKGSVQGVEQLLLNTYDKDTGKLTGKDIPLYHPSQLVKGYAQQAINEIKHQLNPPNVLPFDGGHPLQAINAAYPAVLLTAGTTVPTVAKFLLLGEPGAIKLEEFGLPPLNAHVNYGGTVSIDTYKTQAQTAFAKMPETQIEAIKLYTSGGYKNINDSLSSGNPSSEAIAAATALKTLSHDITPGTVLSRKIHVTNESELKDLLGSVGKVLQETRIISTSINPDIWAGNIHLKLIVGPGVKGLYVGAGSNPGPLLGSMGAISFHKSEQEILLPPNTRLVVTKITSGAKMIDKEGFDGEGSDHIIEAVILPTT